MKENEFIKKHGLQYAKSIIGQFPNHTHVTNDGRMFIDENTCASHIKFLLNELVKIDDLKRLVESHELVESYGGLGEAKEYIYCHGEYEAICDEDGSVCDYASNSELIEAIADVESCQ